jgi:hypothetical protein
MEKKLHWERVDEDWGGEDTPICSTWRAKIEGGWLVSVWAGPSTTDTNKHRNGGGLTFVPDFDWRWDPALHANQKQ